MCVTLSLDKDLHAYLQEQSAATGRTMGQVLSDLVRAGFMATPEGRAELAFAQKQLAAKDGESGIAAQRSTHE